MISRESDIYRITPVKMNREEQKIKINDKIKNSNLFND